MLADHRDDPVGDDGQEHRDRDVGSHRLPAAGVGAGEVHARGGSRADHDEEADALGRLARQGQADAEAREQDHAHVQHPGLDRAGNPLALLGEHELVLGCEADVQQACVEHDQQPGHGHDDHGPGGAFLPGQPADIGDERTTRIPVLACPRYLEQAGPGRGFLVECVHVIVFLGLRSCSLARCLTASP